ncbi:Uncharacterised protein [Legionella wadsworthii]|uniref:Uncharacterized protein n=1 Tax=Legionella wadsworthii TaxID=28088 RepID=A0A378LPI5_9GAMM|nr:Uncharacterised protein [Legionella wadsworthii]
MSTKNRSILVNKCHITIVNQSYFPKRTNDFQIEYKLAAIKC